MPAISKAPIEIVAPHCGGSYKTSALKTLEPMDVSSGKNYRQNDEGGRYPRPGYEDSGIDLSSFTTFNQGRGMLSAKSPKRLWLAVDTGTDVRIVYMDTDVDSEFYDVVVDVGLSLQTGYWVNMIEWEGDIYYANGYNTVGRIIVGQVGTGGVAANSDTLNLKTGNGVRFPTSGTGLAGNGDVFTFGSKSTDQLGGIPTSTGNALTAHSEGELVIITTTLSPQYADKASVLAEWLSSLNLGGDPDNPRVWEFGQFALANDLSLFRTFTGGAANQELLGLGDSISAFLAVKNFFYVWKKDGVYRARRDEINTDNGARIPQPVKNLKGAVNQRCVAQIDDDDAVYVTPDKEIMLLTPKLQDASTDLGLDGRFDNDPEKYLQGLDEPNEDWWVHYNPTENYVKIGVFRNGVREVIVRDISTRKWFAADTNKNYDCVCYHDKKTWAYDGSANKLYIDEVGNYDDTVPVECEWQTGRLGRGEFSYGKAKYVWLHGYMTLGSIAYIDFYKDDEFQFTKTLDDSYVTSRRPQDGVTIGSKGIGSGVVGTGGSGARAYPFRLPIGANHKAEDFKLVFRCNGENGDFVQTDGFTIGVMPLRRYPHKHA